MSAAAKCHAAFEQHARLDSGGFFDAIVEAGHEDLRNSPFADVIFRSSCSPPWGRQGSVAFNGLMAVVDDLSNFKKSVPGAGGASITDAHFDSFMVSILSLLAPAEDVESLAVIFREEGYQAEAFARFDTDGDGTLDMAECSTLFLLAKLLINAFHQGSPTAHGFSREGFGRVLKGLGFTDINKLFSGQFADGVFGRMDADKNGVISLPEFWRGCFRLLRPVRTSAYLRGDMGAVQGWPGWACFQDSHELVRKVNELQTGDVVLMNFDDPTARFATFALDSSWSHAAMVVRREGLDLAGMPNAKTEELLRQHASKRGNHVFCSPGFCRCFGTEGGDFKPSQVAGSGNVLMLESTVQGIHIFDLVHRMFESAHAQRHCSIAVRRLRGATCMRDVSRVSEFLRKVRGSLYSVNAHELHDAIGFHLGSATPAHDDDAKVLERQSFFCSHIVAEFYRHMGLLPVDHESSGVMPGDFAPMPSPSTRPVELVAGDAYFEKLEIIWAPADGATHVHFQPVRFPAKASKL